jgi:hypothetical protein
VDDDTLDTMHYVQRIVLVTSDLQRQKLGVDTAPEDALVFLALTHPFGHTSDTANVLSDLRNHFFRAVVNLLGTPLLRPPVLLPSAMCVYFRSAAQ